MTETAEKAGIPYDREALPGNTYTDAWAIQVMREGIPCALMSLPLKYMHTTVELCHIPLMEAQAHLLAESIAAMNAGWEESLCY